MRWTSRDENMSHLILTFVRKKYKLGDPPCPDSTDAVALFHFFTKFDSKKRERILKLAKEYSPVLGFMLTKNIDEFLKEAKEQ